LEADLRSGLWKKEEMRAAADVDAVRGAGW
jgi:hypothetical protein